MNKRPTYLRPLAVGAVLAIAVVGTGTASAAAGTGSSSGVQVTNTESVQVYVDADGKLGMEHVYEQLTLAGHGKANVVNPITTTGLRNLNGFSGVSVKGGKQVVDTSVDGEKQLRTVSDFHGKLPVKLSISYKLDGKPVKADDIVGKSGHLEVSYTVENTSAVPTQLTFDDGKGGTVTKTVDVPIPMVGSLSTTAPDNFRNVSSKQASMGGDGHGGTQMQFTLTLLPPIGPTKSTFGYSADITDGVVPRAELNALPIDPLSSPSFSGAASSYKGGADTGVQLTDGALQMDAGLVKLRGGASDLVAGLIKLHDGAGQLSDGLADTAVPGANKLADGTTQLADGGKKLKDGANQLNDGLKQLKSKAPELGDGVHQIYAGQKDLAAGLTQLYTAVDALPDSVKKQVNEDPSYKQLVGALGAVVDGIGSDGQATSLLGGLTALKDGLDQGAAALADASSKIAGALPSDPSDPAYAALATAKGEVDAARAGITTSTASQPSADDAISAMKHALDHTCSGTDCGMKQALQLLQLGIPVLVSKLSNQISDELTAALGTPTQGCDPTKTLRCGAAALVDGGKQLDDAVPQLTEGVDQLAAGSQQLAGGAGDLSDGLGQANTGAHQLADGLGDAADGAGQIDDGLGDAAGGAPQLVDGARQLSTDGSQKIAQAGQETAQSYGEMYAELVAGAKRADTESMAVGAPEGAAAMTAYDFIITGADGQGGRNATRTMLAGGLLVVTAGGLLLRRRFTA